MMFRMPRIILSRMNAQIVMIGMLKPQIQSSVRPPLFFLPSPFISVSGSWLRKFASDAGTENATLGLTFLRNPGANGSGSVMSAGAIGPDSYHGTMRNSSLYGLQ